MDARSRETFPRVDLWHASTAAPKRSSSPAKLSEDKRLLEAVERSDVYIELAVAAGLAPPGATKQSHPSERDLAKICFLGVGYGMQAAGLAMRTGLDAD